MIPYSWEPQDDAYAGFFCIFTEEFFSQYGNLKEYPMFKPGHNKVYILTDSQAGEIESLYQQMFAEINSDFEYKYDVIRGLVFSLVHDALKMQPAETTEVLPSNAAARITAMFVELLERQFPIETAVQRVRFRSPIDFSNQLSVHVNHLNRSLKEVTGKTTSQMISERLVQEAKMLLRHTNWNVSEIGFCLGFDEPSHFINFFRKNHKESPKAYRDRLVV
jgi:AraC-like DNA-binding protein